MEPVHTNPLSERFQSSSQLGLIPLASRFALHTNMYPFAVFATTRSKQRARPYYSVRNCSASPEAPALFG
jgi:hypothetical protein